MEFQVIVADPPWQNSDQLTMSDVARGGTANYDTMSINDLKNLDINSIADKDNCVLCLWVLGSMLEEGMDLMKTWGFKHKQVYVWVKVKKDPFSTFKDLLFENVKNFINSKPKSIALVDIKNIIKDGFAIFSLQDILAFGMGRLFRQTHEICLIGTKGKKVYKNLKNKSQRSVSFALNEGHSIKPKYLQDSLDLMFPDANKLEMFARRDRDGWTCVGLECPSSIGEDIKDSLKRVSGM